MKGCFHVMETCKTCRSGLAFYPEHLAPVKLQDPGPPPTCPFIDNHNFKEPPTRNGGQLSFPAIAIGGHLSVSVGDRLERGVFRRAPSGEQASRPLSDSRQQPFCNFVSKVVRGAGRGPGRKDEMVSESAEFKGSTMGEKARTLSEAAYAAR